MQTQHQHTIPSTKTIFVGFDVSAVASLLLQHRQMLS